MHSNKGGKKKEKKKDNNNRKFYKTVKKMHRIEKRQI